MNNLLSVKSFTSKKNIVYLYLKKNNEIHILSFFNLYLIEIKKAPEGFNFEI